ncbi:MAG: replicative DNA helicase [Rhodobacteraceae bacterium]|nr:replicative DNA helicase [Paracoccaceae bacterium]
MKEDQMNVSVISGQSKAVDASTNEAEPTDMAATIPHNSQIEKALLGAILYDNEHYQNVMKIITADDFYNSTNRAIFEKIHAMIIGNRLASLDTIRNYIVGDPQIRSIGVAKYLSDISSYYMNPRRVVEIAEQIHELANLRRLIKLGDGLQQRAADMRPETRSQDLIEEAESQLYQLRKDGAAHVGFRQVSNILPESIQEARLARDRDSDHAGLPTGLADLDMKIGGLQRSDLIIIAARPGMGKTALATNIAVNVASKYEVIEHADGEKTQLGGKIAFFSLEMSAKQLMSRILSAETRIAANEIVTRRMSPDEFEQYKDAALRIVGLPIFIDDSGGLSIADVILRAKQLHRKENGIHAIVVDYIQLMRGTDTSQSRNYEVAQITSGLKSLAKVLDVPVIAISQLNRAVDSRNDPRPQLSDLRDSGAIEQDADLVMFVERQSYYTKNKEPDQADQQSYEKWKENYEKHHGKAMLVIAKNRNGPTGTIPLAFDGRYTKFSNAVRDET